MYHCRVCGSLSSKPERPNRKNWAPASYINTTILSFICIILAMAFTKPKLKISQDGNLSEADLRAIETSAYVLAKFKEWLDKRGKLCDYANISTTEFNDLLRKLQTKMESLSVLKPSGSSHTLKNVNKKLKGQITFKENLKIPAPLIVKTEQLQAEIPADLRQRFIPFGSGSPYISSPSKRKKKKSGKHSPKSRKIEENSSNNVADTDSVHGKDSSIVDMMGGITPVQLKKIKNRSSSTEKTPQTKKVKYKEQKDKDNESFISFPNIKQEVVGSDLDAENSTPYKHKKKKKDRKSTTPLKTVKQEPLDLGVSQEDSPVNTHKKKKKKKVTL
ncbi:hypothetical protein GQR58_027659 [Nymphon striatum]|nr:hypothetical protein GQR58_027659 [Nymphon striatum]